MQQYCDGIESESELSRAQREINEYVEARRNRLSQSLENDTIEHGEAEDLDIYPHVETGDLNCTDPELLTQAAK